MQVRTEESASFPSQNLAILMAFSLFSWRFASPALQLFLCLGSHCLFIKHMFVVEFTYQSMKKQAICSIGLLTGGSVISQIGLTYLVIGLLDNFGWQRTLQILGAMLSVICILAALTYIPMNSGPETVDQNLQKKTGFKEYVSLLKNKRFVAFLVANILAGFSYSVTSVHQASKGNIKIKKSSFDFTTLLFG